MAALSDLKGFFQPKKFHDLQLLAKGQVEKASLSQSKFAGKQTKPFADPELAVKGGI